MKVTSGDLGLPVPVMSSDAREVSVTDRTNVRFVLGVGMLESFGDAEKSMADLFGDVDAAMADQAGRFIVIKRCKPNALLI